MAEEPGRAGVLHVTVAASLRPAQVREWQLQLPAGATVTDALRACGLDVHEGRLSCGVWGRAARPNQQLHDGDRVECCRPLTVDPKLARRQRFASQGARAAGLFAKRRPGSKAGY
ncbi:RnfH family protein [Diaphorobacter sp.]|uniref:RnfH family protein n=1 Tax=Diaphorobacter sp. TaxID=1934310 RepID=UPI003D0C9584